MMRRAKRKEPSRKEIFYRLIEMHEFMRLYEGLGSIQKVYEHEYERWLSWNKDGRELHFITARFGSLKPYEDSESWESLDILKEWGSSKLGLLQDYAKFIRDKNLVDRKEKDGKSKKPEIFHLLLLFAKGKVQPFMEKHKNGNSWDQIAKELGYPTLRPYISNTLFQSKGDKNLYLKNSLMKEVYNYCVAEKITMCKDFSENYLRIQT